MQRTRTFFCIMTMLGSLCLAAVVTAEPYELSKERRN